MENFDLYILGCGAAIPTIQHLPSAQVLSMRGKNYIIDCGEGMQLSYRKSRLKFSDIHAIFISHMHGDHCFGLPGLLSTLCLLGRTATLPIYGPIGLKVYIDGIINSFLTPCSYSIEVKEHTDDSMLQVYEDTSIIVKTIPLKHRIPTTGYLFEEKCAVRHIDSEMVKYYNVPISYYQYLIAGEDYIGKDGDLIKNEILTKKGRTPRKYAYCSDTKYSPSIVELIKGVDLLYHEATFAEDAVNRLLETAHSSAKQAGKIAMMAGVKKLVIGHFSGRYISLDQLLKEAREEFEDTICAEENLVIKI